MSSAERNKLSTITSLVGGHVIAGEELIDNGRVSWDENGVILAIDQKPVHSDRVINADGFLVSPGFINLHIHGGLGYDVLDASPAAFEAISRHQAQQGVTAFLPTTTSTSQEKIVAVAGAFRAYIQAPLRGAHPLGLHMEGPYLSFEKKGAQNPAHFRNPSWDELRQWQRASGNAVRMIALAPERDEQGEFISRVVADGVVVAAAHTNASYVTAQRAMASGLSHGTHVFNAMSQFDYRNPGILEALLENDHITLELIPDCTTIPHVHPVAIRLLKRIVGVERLCTITDAVSAAGMPQGSYELGGLKVIKAENMVYLEEPWLASGQRQLAGSVLEMNHGIHNLIEQAGFSLQEAVQTGTANPARVLKIFDRKGSLDVGKHADIVVVDPITFEVEATFVRGVNVYTRTKDHEGKR